MLKHYHVSDKYEEVCEWYDGYLFGDTEIFNKTNQNVIAISIAQAIFSGDTKELQKQLDKFMVESISSFDTANEDSKNMCHIVNDSCGSAVSEYKHNVYKSRGKDKKE